MADMIHIEELMSQMYEKDSGVAFKSLQELEKISDETGLLYPYTEKFISLIKDDRYVMRIRGFRLFCKQAKWDVDYILDENIDSALNILSDARPTAVRQGLAALKDIILFKPDLRDIVCSAASKINYLKYKDTMHSLIAKDIRDLLALVKSMNA